MSRAPRNRTLTLATADTHRLRPQLLSEVDLALGDAPDNRVVCAAMEATLLKLPPNSVDLLFLDPPYNLTKQFGAGKFRQGSNEQYAAYLQSWLPGLKRALKPTASVYLCSDWRASAACQEVLEAHFNVRNRITWEREKGRGALRNWKNAHEDIWFATVGEEYTFNVEAVKLQRRVIAPYRQNGKPKDWRSTAHGDFRLTHPSNLWTDLTVPFWSMPENTEHPTQKPEKLLAKLLLASTKPGDLVLDPFAGSGTTAVVAQKLGRKFIAIEQEEAFALMALRRLELAEADTRIQGYADGVFWERNSAPKGDSAFSAVLEGEREATDWAPPPASSATRRHGR